MPRDANFMVEPGGDARLLALEAKWRKFTEDWERICNLADRALEALPEWARRETLVRMSPAQRSAALFSVREAATAGALDVNDNAARRAFLRRYLDPEEAQRDRDAESMLTATGYYELQRREAEACERWMEMEREIAQTPTGGLAGLAVKLRLWWRYAQVDFAADGERGVWEMIDERLIDSIEIDIDRMGG